MVALLLRAPLFKVSAKEMGPDQLFGWQLASHLSKPCIIMAMCPHSPAINSQLTLLTRMIYVNNCNLLIFVPSFNNLAVAIRALQHSVLLWQGSLRATGGSLSQEMLMGFIILSTLQTLVAAP